MKIYKYKFSRTMKVLMIAALVLCAAGFAVNLTFLIKDGISVSQPVYAVLRYALMFFVTIALAAIIISIMASSAYIIDGKTFKTKFGFIVSKYDVDKIDSVVLDRKSGKLTVTFENDEFIVIVVKQEWYNDFIENLIKANTDIEYSIVSLDNVDNPPDKN